MRRRRFLALAAMGAVAAVTSAPAAERIFRIGALFVGSPGAGGGFGDVTWRRELPALGYVEGQNLRVEERFAGESPARAQELARELASLGVDLIVAQSSPLAHAAKSAVGTIPIVATVADAVGTGLVASLARPGGNLTGVSLNMIEPAAKRLELLRELLPGLARVAYLVSPGDPAMPLFVREIEAAGRSLGIAVRPVSVSAPSELAVAFETIRTGQAQALLVQPLFTPHRAEIMARAQRQRLPVASDYRAFAAAGAVLTYGADGTETARRTAAFIDRILRGAKPADLPMEEPTRYELVLNRPSAAALGLDIPPALLARADEVIE